MGTEKDGVNVKSSEFGDRYNNWPIRRSLLAEEGRIRGFWQAGNFTRRRGGAERKNLLPQIDADGTDWGKRSGDRMIGRSGDRQSKSSPRRRGEAEPLPQITRMSADQKEQNLPLIKTDHPA